ncbi:MAG: radical SAM protein [Thermodesulfobacteriota bacterium]
MMKQTVSFSKDESNVFFHILTRCNLRCRHCYINPTQHGTKMLSVEKIGIWLREISKKTKKANLIFLGGEPTLHPKLSLAVQKARSLGYQSITIDTNGYLFNNILDAVTPDLVDYFSFSLDGAGPETNDPLRGKGSFHACLSGIRNAIQKGYHTSLIFTVSRDNIHELKRMPPLLASLGIHRFFIQVIGLRGKAAAKERKVEQVGINPWMKIIPTIAERIAKQGIPVIYPKVYLHPDEPFECAGVVSDNYFIFPNGRVYRCPLCEDYPLHGFEFKNNRLVKTKGITETHLFQLNIPEGCVMNRLIQPGNIRYRRDGTPRYKIACCLLKNKVTPHKA